MEETYYWDHWLPCSFEKSIGDEDVALDQPRNKSSDEGMKLSLHKCKGDEEAQGLLAAQEIEKPTNSGDELEDQNYSTLKQLMGSCQKP